MTRRAGHVALVEKSTHSKTGQIQQEVLRASRELTRPLDTYRAARVIEVFDAVDH